MGYFLLSIYLPNSGGTVFTGRCQILSVGTEVNGRYFTLMAHAGDFSSGSIPGILVHLPYPVSVVLAGRGNLVTTWADGDSPYFSCVMQLCERNPIIRVHQPNDVTRSQSNVVPVLAEGDFTNRPL